MEAKTNTKNEWAVRIKVLCISAIFASIANFISTYKAGAPVTPLEAVPALLMMFAIIVVGCLIKELVEKVFKKVQLPTILYISLISMICSIPGLFPFAEYLVAEFNKVGLLSLCTPILAYAGISIGKDLNEFKKQGVAIVCVSLLTFLGTFVGSAFIAQLVLTFTGVI